MTEPVGVPAASQTWKDEVATLRGTLACHKYAYRRHAFYRHACRAAEKAGAWSGGAVALADVRACLEKAARSLIQEMLSTRTLRLCGVLLGMVAYLHSMCFQPPATGSILAKASAPPAFEPKSSAAASPATPVDARGSKRKADDVADSANDAKRACRAEDGGAGGKPAEALGKGVPAAAKGAKKGRKPGKGQGKGQGKGKKPQGAASLTVGLKMLGSL